jgi:hypothetical protein
MCCSGEDQRENKEERRNDKGCVALVKIKGETRRREGMTKDVLLW